jgi:glycerol-3-phosphate cytidylyltransferase
MVIGYVAGVYDLFHIGHLRQLQCAKACCDRLIVGVITDELAESYKYKPIIPFTQRREIISALECVDGTVECTTRNFYEQWHKIKFDVALSGEDWMNDPLYKEWSEQLKAVGSHIKFLPYTNGISTTLIKQIIIDRGRNA